MRTFFTLAILLSAELLLAQGPFNCTAEAYLFQYNDIYSINLASGQAVLEAEDVTAGNINAAAYNPADGYIWGSLTSPDQAIVRIGQNMTTETYMIPGFPTANPYVGAISSSGKYHLKSGGTDYHIVDLDPASATYLELIDSKSLDQNISIADWAFNSVDGALYTVTIGTNLLCRIDSDSGAVTVLGEVPILSGLNYTYGAVYFDVDGNFYVSANQTGTIYIVNAVQDIALNGVMNSNLFSFGPASASNDGARCPTAPVPQEICDNGIDDDGDGLVDCDDPSCSGVSNCPVDNTTSGGNNGGLESNSRMSDLIAKRNYNRALVASPATIGIALEKHSVANLKPYKNVINLKDLIPIGIIKETEALESSPADLISITNATEVFAVDYRNESGNIASVLALSTEKGVYEHSKFICDRLLGAELNSVSQIYIKEQPFTKSIIYRSDGKKEFVLSFAIRSTDDGLVVESHWNLDGYTVDEDYYNFQIWTANIDDLITLAEGILDLVEFYEPIASYDTSPAPFVFVQRARVDNGKLILQLMNNDFSKELILKGGMRRTETEDFEIVEESMAIGPYKNEIVLDLGHFFDFGMRLSTERSGTPDDLFVSEGPWGFDDSALSTQVSTYEVTRTELLRTENNFPLNRGVHFSAVTKDYIAVYRALTPRFEAVDLSQMNQLSFSAGGSGPLEVTLISNSVEQWEDQFHAKVLLDNEMQTFEVSKGDFTNMQGLEPHWSDVEMIVFTLRSETGEMESKELELSDLEFKNVSVTSSSELNSEGTLAYPNPASDYIKIDLEATVGVASVSLYNSQGKLVIDNLSDPNVDDVLGIDLSKLEVGTYTLLVGSTVGMHTEKIVIMR